MAGNGAKRAVPGTSTDNGYRILNHTKGGDVLLGMGFSGVGKCVQCIKLTFCKWRLGRMLDKPLILLFLQDVNRACRPAEFVYCQLTIKKMRDILLQFSVGRQKEKL